MWAGGKWRAPVERDPSVAEEVLSIRPTIGRLRHDEGSKVLLALPDDRAAEPLIEGARGLVGRRDPQHEGTVALPDQPARRLTDQSSPEAVSLPPGQDINGVDLGVVRVLS